MKLAIISTVCISIFILIGFWLFYDTEYTDDTNDTNDINDTSDTK